MRLKEPTEGLKSGLVVINTKDGWHDLRFYSRTRSSMLEDRRYYDTATAVDVGQKADAAH